LNGILDNTISNNTYFGSLPESSAIPAEWNDMCFVEIPNGIRDMEAYGQGTVLVWLYARPMSSGRKNVAVMSQLEQRLNEVIANNTDRTYQISRRLTYTSYDTDIKWHCNVVELILKIF
jgi:hypothetical protein